MDDVSQTPRALPQTLLREATEARLFTEVIGRGRTTRAELAAATGISKPTVSEAVRRLVAGRLLDATGLQETGRRGRVGTFYELGTAAGWVLAIEVDQAGVKAWSADLAGRVVHRHEEPPGAAGDTEALTATLRRAAEQAVTGTGTGHGPLRSVAVSVANPVHPASHEVIPLPGSPFPEGLFNPVDVLAGLVERASGSGPVLPVPPVPILVDNDVNLAALAEYRTGAAVGAASFAYVYVGAGLGLGLYVGDQLIRGAHGLAGEIGYLPGGETASGLRTLAAELDAAGLGRSDAPSTDVGTVLRLLDLAAGRAETAGRGDGDEELRAQRALQVLGGAVARAVASVRAVVDPELVLLGGPVGNHPALLEPVREALAPITVGPSRLAYGTLGVLAPLYGAIQLALDRARALAITRLGGPLPR